jgi:hypothetical protein
VVSPVLLQGLTSNKVTCSDRGVNTNDLSHTRSVGKNRVVANSAELGNFSTCDRWVS